MNLLDYKYSVAIGDYRGLDGYVECKAPLIDLSYYLDFIRKSKLQNTMYNVDVRYHGIRIGSVYAQWNHTHELAFQGIMDKVNKHQST